MAKMVQADSRRMYSWWWDSHISPKNSKWLQENLSGMDDKIKQMIKLVEEDADSFARRAEMYYKKRPDLLKLVEDFYRAYRALAERYDHATGVLRQAHRSMAEAFPNQVPPDLDDSILPLSSTDLEDTKELDNDFVGQFLRKELVKLEAENEACLLQYKQCLVKMTGLENAIERDQEDAQKLKQELVRVEEEKEDVTGRYKKSLDSISCLEEKLTEVTDRSNRAETEAELWRQALEKTTEEKESVSAECSRLLTKLVEVESKMIFQSEEMTSLKSCNRDLQERVEKADQENKNLKELNSSSSSLIDSLRGESSSMREIIRKLETEVEIQVEEQNTLHQEIYLFKEKMNMLKEKYLLVMEQVESVGLDPESVRSYVKKLQDEKSKLRDFCDRKVRENASLLERNSLLERSVSGLNSELEEVKQKLQDEQLKLKELCDQKLSENAALLEKNALLEKSISALSSESEEAKGKLQDALLQLGEFYGCKSKENATLLEKNAVLESSVSGLNSELIEVKQKLQDELSRLREFNDDNLRKNNDLLEKNVFLEKSVFGLNSELEEVKQKLQAEKAKSREVHDENMALLEKKANLEDSVSRFETDMEEVRRKLKVSEESRASLICQLQVATEKSEMLEQKTGNSENSLSNANAEIERLRIMLKKSEESWLLLFNEKLGLITERESLSYQLDTTKRRLEDSVLRCEELERKCVSFDREREENAVSAELSKTREVALESRVLLLRQEALSRNREFKEELDKALNSHLEIFILKNCIQDLEEKNLSLSLECQKLMKACESSERLKFLTQENTSRKVQDLQNFMSVLLDENSQIVVEKSVLDTVIEEMRLEAMKVVTERDALYEDLKVQSNRLSEVNREAKFREQKLCIDLLKEKHEVDLWEAQATDFFSEMMISGFRVALLEEKVREFAQSEAEESELLGARIRFLEDENFHLMSKIAVLTSAEPLSKDCALENRGSIHKEPLRPETEEIQSWQDIKLITHLKSINNSVDEAAQHAERGILPENSASSAKSEDGTRQVDGLRSRRRANDPKTRHASRRKEVMKHTNRVGKKPAQHTVHPESEVLTKDIVLDQTSEFGTSRSRRGTVMGSDERMLELWETTDLSGSIDLKVGISRRAIHPSRESFSEKELGVDKIEVSGKCSTEPHRGGRNPRRVLERLNIDAQKLTNLQITVQDLKRKVEVSERSGTERVAEYKEVREQLDEAELTILNFFDVNHKLTKSVQKAFLSRSSGTDTNDDYGSGVRRRISEQARRGSDKIAKLQVEVQRVQFLLLKLDDEVEKESRGGLRTARVPERKTRVLLKDFLHVRVRANLKRKKGQFCSCVQLPTRAK